MQHPSITVDDAASTSAPSRQESAAEIIASPDSAPVASAPSGARAPSSARTPSLARELVTLTKPRITIFVAFTAFGGYWLACRHLGIDPLSHGAFGWRGAKLVAMLLGTGLVVSGANALNMYLERDTDALMARTANRPLPRGRMESGLALGLGMSLSAMSLPILTFGVHAITGLLAAIALVSYVLLYTPMKRRSPASLVVGAVPGAIPPLLGWSAARGTLDGPGIVLFGILFLWQIPHFLAIATFRKEDYRRAGMKVLTVVSGDRVARHHAVRYLAALLLMSFLLVPFRVGGTAYLATALLLGSLFFGVGLWGLRRDAGVRWAKGLFFTSLIYLVGIFGALTVG